MTQIYPSLLHHFENLKGSASLDLKKIQPTVFCTEKNDFIGMVQKNHEVHLRKALFMSSFLFVHLSYSFAHGLFASPSVQHLRIEGPFSTAFNAAHAGSPDGIIPPIRRKEPFSAKLSYTHDGQTIYHEVKMAVRGNNSLVECDFAKLKFEILDSVIGSVFAENKKVKVGTHCGEDSGEISLRKRLRNQLTTHREAWLYEVLSVMQFPAQRTQPARVVWSDTSEVAPEWGREIERNSFLLEDAKLAAKRLNLKLEDEEKKWEDEEKSNWDLESLAKMYLFQAMIGNWDWRLPSGRGPFVHNFEVYKNAQGVFIFQPSDFDLASIVTGHPLKETANELRGLYPDKPVLFRQAAYYALSIRKEALLTESHVAKAKQNFLQQLPGIRAKLENYPMDDAGKRIFLEHLAAFESVLNEIF